MTSLLQEEVGVEELRALVYGGYMHLPSSQTCVMALKHLADAGML